MVSSSNAIMICRNCYTFWVGRTQTNIILRFNISLTNMRGTFTSSCAVLVNGISFSFPHTFHLLKINFKCHIRVNRNFFGKKSCIKNCSSVISPFIFHLHRLFLISKTQTVWCIRLQQKQHMRAFVVCSSLSSSKSKKRVFYSLQRVWQ